MDCSIVASQKYPSFFTVSTVDFFYPLVEDPYLQGRIAACNVLSDMYSLGIDHIDSVLMTLAASSLMEPRVRHIVTEQMMRGFGDICKEAGTSVTGGQTIVNPWPIVGGVAKSVLKEGDFIRPESAVAGDLLVLTKPLGTQVAVNMREWLYQPDRREALLKLVTEGDVDRSFSVAQASMGRLNRNAARLMQKYHAHAATDVTGFGILGHADNLAKNQKASVGFLIERLPCIASTMKVATQYPFFKLQEGYSAETSGGLLISLPADDAERYCRELEEVEGWPAWIVGKVVQGGDRVATLSTSLEIIEV